MRVNRDTSWLRDQDGLAVTGIGELPVELLPELNATLDLFQRGWPLTRHVFELPNGQGAGNAAATFQIVPNSQTQWQALLALSVNHGGGAAAGTCVLGYRITAGASVGNGGIVASTFSVSNGGINKPWAQDLIGLPNQGGIIPGGFALLLPPNIQNVDIAMDVPATAAGETYNWRVWRAIAPVGFNPFR